MSIEVITLLAFGLLVVLLVLGQPIAFASGAVAAIFVLFLWGPPGFMMVMARVWGTMTEFILIAVPMFIFMALMLTRAGVGEDLFNAIYHWLGPIRGGLAVSTVLACAILAAMVGIVGAGVVMMGLIALPAMLKHNYRKDLALGSVCAGGTLGQLIPPSTLFIVYGLAAGVSIAQLFAGGVFPGLVLAMLFSTYILIRSFLQPDLAPALSEKERAMVSLKQKFILLRGLVLPIFLVILVLGAIFGGIATPSEAAGVGALGSIICAAVNRRLNWQALKEVLFQATKVTCMILWLVWSASLITGFYTLAGGAQFVREVMLGLPFGHWGIIIVMQLILIVAGMFIDPTGIIMIAAPLFVPIIMEMGFDPVWFGIVFNVNMQMAYLTPPFGHAMFYLKGVTPPDITMTDIYRSIWPFVLLQLIGLILLLVFPQIGMWLPGVLLGGG